MTICEKHPEYSGGKPDTDCPKCNKHFYKEGKADKAVTPKKKDPYKRRDKYQKDWLEYSTEEADEQES